MNKDVFMQRLAVFWSIVSTIYIFAITFASINENNIRFADTILGFLLGTIIATIINYFFGSSKSSADKNEMIATLTSDSGKDMQ